MKRYERQQVRPAGLVTGPPVPLPHQVIHKLPGQRSAPSAAATWPPPASLSVDSDFCWNQVGETEDVRDRRESGDERDVAGSSLKEMVLGSRRCRVGTGPVSAGPMNSNSVVFMMLA